MAKAPDALEALVGSMTIPRRERQIAEILIELFPRFVSKSLLIGRIYDDEREDIPWPGEALQSHISKLRSKMVGTGWSIESSRFVGYRFVNAERDQLSAAATRRAQR